MLQAGGNAIDAAIATSLALGVAEPYASGLGGKLMLLYYEAKSGRTYAVDAMDAAGSLDVTAYLQRPDEDRSYGYGAVCVPGLAAGLWALHEKWGALKWADDVQPSIRSSRARDSRSYRRRAIFSRSRTRNFTAATRRLRGSICPTGRCRRSAPSCRTRIWPTRLSCSPSTDATVFTEARSPRPSWRRPSGAGE